VKTKWKEKSKQKPQLPYLQLLDTMFNMSWFLIHACALRCRLSRTLVKLAASSGICADDKNSVNNTIRIKSGWSTHIRITHKTLADECTQKVPFCVALDNFLNLTIRPNVISVAYSTFVVEVYMAFLPLCGSIAQNWMHGIFTIGLKILELQDCDVFRIHAVWIFIF
jgi:hypothetical protein